MASIHIKIEQLYLSCILLCYSVTGVSQNHTATVREYNQVFTTYPYSDPNPIPNLTSLYPYFRYEGYTNQSVLKAWKVVELENEYIKVLILPEIGGKIWTAIEKSTNQPFIYYNHAVKFRDIAMRGPYTSGGLELNYGIIGHTPNCATPVDYVTQENPDGSVSCTVGVLDLLTRTSWRLEIRLQKDKAYFTTKTFWHNSTPIGQPYYHWMNGGFKADGNLEFIFPGNRYIGHEGEYNDWPVNKTNGKNISFYESNNFGGYKSYHVFGKYTDFSGGYWHNDDFGVVRYGSHDDKAGKKIWIWGLSRQGMIWEKILTDTDGQYVEMQSGRLFNQNSGSATLTPFKHLSFAPYSTDIWTEIWYPVLHTKGFIEANEYGALNVKNEDGFIKIYFSPVQNIDDLLEISDNQKVIYSKKILLSPLNTFVDSIKFTGILQNLIVTLGEDKLVYNSDPNANVLSRPVDAPTDFDWNSSYGLFILGKNAMDEKMYPEAEEKLKASLHKDPNYLPALTIMAELQFRNLRYTEALETSKKALSIDTHNGEANYYYGLVNAVLGNIVDAKDGFDLATLSAEYRCAAYTELSRLYLKEKKYLRAVDYARRAVDYNAYNIEALQLQAVSYRKLKSPGNENEILKTILTYDPLNHFSRFEKYLENPVEDNLVKFTSLIRNELSRETYIELAVWYYNAGFPEEAEKIFSLSPQSAETIYWLSYLQHKKVNCSDINPDYVFPFRPETALIIEQILTKQDDWILKYHLALIYKDRNRTEDCIKLLTSCKSVPEFAPFYAYRALMEKGKNDSLCEIDLNTALSFDKQWRYQKLLVNFYNEHQQNEKALSITESFYHAHPENIMMGALHAHNLLLNSKYKEADALLSKIEIIPFEGSTEGRELYREAKLMQAVQLMQKNKHSAALEFIVEARLWPENLGVGMPYPEDIDLRLEDWMEYLCNQKTKNLSGAEKMLKNITRFEPRIENTVRNFVPENALISAWAYEILDGKEKAVQWIDGQIKSFPQDELILWSKEKFLQENTFQIKKTIKDANVRIIENLMQQGK